MKLFDQSISLLSSVGLERVALNLVVVGSNPTADTQHGFPSLVKGE